MEATREELLARIAELERKASKSKKTDGGLWFKVAAKGGISVYGLNKRFPVTMYADQLEKFLAHAEPIRAFIAENKGLLSVKPVAESAEVVPAEIAQAATA